MPTTVKDTKVKVLTAFLYDLLRDELPAGKVEGMVREAEKCRGKEIRYTTGPLAELALSIAHRLTD
jgi:hypothetical protein